MTKDNPVLMVPLQWFTVEESAHYLRVSRRTIYKWTRAGRLTAYVIGDKRYRRYRKEDLDNLPRRAEPQTESLKRPEVP